MERRQVEVLLYDSSVPLFDVLEDLWKAEHPTSVIPDAFIVAEGLKALVRMEMERLRRVDGSTLEPAKKQMFIEEMERVLSKD